VTSCITAHRAGYNPIDFEKETAMTISAWIWLGLILAGITLYTYYARIGKLLRCACFTAFSGAGALGVLWILGIWFSVPISITPLTLTASVIMGIPGVLAMLILHLI
jgi:hypothetical protein